MTATRPIRAGIQPRFGPRPLARTGGNLCRASTPRECLRALKGGKERRASAPFSLSPEGFFKDSSAPALASPRETLRSTDMFDTQCAVAPVKGAAVRACSDARPG